jgi:hypothetical protein
MMLAEHSDCTGLWALIAFFLDECDLGSDGEACPSFLEHACAMKVDLPSVGHFDEAMILGQRDDASMARRLMGLDVATLAPGNILQPAPSRVERLADGHLRVLGHGPDVIVFVMSLALHVLQSPMERRLMADDHILTRQG